MAKRLSSALGSAIRSLAALILACAITVPATALGAGLLKALGISPVASMLIGSVFGLWVGARVAMGVLYPKASHPSAPGQARSRRAAQPPAVIRRRQAAIGAATMGTAAGAHLANAAGHDDDRLASSFDDDDNGGGTGADDVLRGNPATGLPMVGALDSAGNPFGVGDTTSGDEHRISACSGVNPATGLPMIDDTCIDVMGNPYGTDLSSTDHSDMFNQDDSFHHSVSTFDDDWRSSSSSDDSWSSSSDDSWSSSSDDSWSSSSDDS